MFIHDTPQGESDKNFSNEDQDIRLEFWKAKGQLFRLSLALA